MFHKTVIALLAITCLAGCGIGTHCISANGSPITKELVVPAFTGITNSGSIDVEVVKGDVQRVEVTGPPEIVAMMKTAVSGNVWEIATEKCYSTRGQVDVRITTPGLSSITTDGSGDVHSDDVFIDGKLSFTTSGSGDIMITGMNGKEVEVMTEGSGSITLNGTCTDLDAKSEGSGDVHAQGLSANKVKARIEGSGGMDVTAISELDANVQGSGNVRYRGKPQVSSKVEGSGSVVPME